MNLLTQDELPHTAQKEAEFALPPPKLDTGLACLVMMARLHGVPADADQLVHEAATSGHVFGVADLLMASKKMTLQAKSVKVAIDRLAKTPLPAIAVGRVLQKLI